MTVRLQVLPAAAWAERVAADLGDRIRAQPRLRLCLPTGDTPTPVHEELVRRARAGELSFRAVEIVLLDEYLGLPPDSPARCDRRLRRELVDRLPEPPAAFHAIAVDALEPDEAAARHDAVAAGLDLVVLGLGMNGHVGLNEPGSPADAPTRTVRIAATSEAAAVRRYGAATPPTGGVTIGLARILEAREVWLLVTGARKRAILRRSLEEPESGDVPGSWLRRHSALTVYADDAAAAGLAAVAGSGPAPS